VKKPAIVKDSVYRIEFFVLISTFDEFIEWHRARYPTWRGEHNNANAKCLTMMDRENRFHEYIVWLKDGRSHEETLFSIAHETLHLVWSILDDKGLRLSNDSEEAFACYYESCFRAIYRIWRLSVRNGRRNHRNARRSKRQ
jgi:hypothetical protein